MGPQHSPCGSRCGATIMRAQQKRESLCGPNGRPGLPECQESSPPSYARDEATQESDLDLLVDLPRGAWLLDLVGWKWTCPRSWTLRSTPRRTAPCTRPYGTGSWRTRSGSLTAHDPRLYVIHRIAAVRLRSEGSSLRSLARVRVRQQNSDPWCRVNAIGFASLSLR